MSSNILLPELAHDIRVLIESLHHHAEFNQFRCMVVITGSHPWCLAAVQAALLDVSSDNILWISHAAPTGSWVLHGTQVLEILGREIDCLVFDAFSGFSPDTFGAVSGSVCAGGIIFLLSPPLREWPRFADPEKRSMAVYPYLPEDVSGRFLQRMARILAKNLASIIQQDIPIPKPISISPIQTKPVTPKKKEGSQAFCRTVDQWHAVEMIFRVAHGGRRRPLVLESDRGRGKSGALGIAAGQLLKEGCGDIILTGPRLEAVESVFRMAYLVLPNAQLSQTFLSFADKRLYYLPPDELVRTNPAAALLLVDEAAAIPVPLLEKCLEKYSRVVFATTLHGYEGTGQGFAIRFQKILERRSRGCRRLLLASPIRWAEGDPVERLVFRCLLLQATAAPNETVEKAKSTQCHIERLNKDALVQDERLLTDLFGLLVLAHYRTRPYDLRYLLDGPNLAVYAMRFRGRVVATALVAEEGGFDAASAQRIWAGHTRPRGHLLAEALAIHLDLKQAPILRCARIIRIAVHPVVQGKGLGTYLLRYLIQQTSMAGLDYIGSSFGATEALLRFWRQAGFFPVRISNRCGATSGVHSVLVLHFLSKQGQQLFAKARDYLNYQLPHQLADPIRMLDPVLASDLLLEHQAIQAKVLSTRDQEGITAFVAGRQSYEACLACLWSFSCLILRFFSFREVLNKADCELLVRKVLQRQSWEEVAKVMNFTGRADVVDQLRNTISKGFGAYSKLIL